MQEKIHIVLAMMIAQADDFAECLVIFHLVLHSGVEQLLGQHRCAKVLVVQIDERSALELIQRSPLVFFAMAKTL